MSHKIYGTNMHTLRVLSVVVGSIWAAIAGSAGTFSWTSIPAGVPSGQQYTVSVSYAGAGSVVLLKNGTYFAGGGSSASGLTTDTGVQTVTYTAQAYGGTVPGGFASTARTVSITGKVDQSAVTILPASQTITIGSSLDFTASGAGVGGYNWGGTCGATGTGATKSVTFGSLGTFTVTVQSPGNASTNPSNTATATITVAMASQSAVSITPASQTVNYGTTLSFTASGGGVGGYRWGGSSGATGTGATRDVAFNNVGSFSVTVQSPGDSTTGPSNTATATITVVNPNSLGWNVLPPQPVTYGATSYPLKCTASISGQTLMIFIKAPSGDWVQCGAGGGVSPVTASGVVTLNAPGAWEAKAVDGGYANSPTVLGPTTLVVRNTQTITFANPGSRTYGSAPFTLGATATSGLPVSYSVTGPASVSGSTLTLTGVGTVTVTASQTGNANYAAASEVVQSFTVNKGSQVISFSSPGTHTYGDAALTLNATSSSGLPITYTVTGPASLSGSTLTLTGAGTVGVTASQAGNATYNAAADVGYSFTVNRRTQSSVTLSPGAQTVTVGSALDFTASGGGVGGYSWGGTGGASGTGTTKSITFSSVGTYTITVLSPGDANTTASNTAMVTIAVVRVDQSAVTLSPGSQTVNLGAALAFRAAGGGVGGYVWGGTAGASGSETTKSVTFDRTGTYTVTVYSPGDSTTNASNVATVTIVVANPNSLGWNVLPPQPVTSGATSYPLKCTASISGQTMMIFVKAPSGDWVQCGAGGGVSPVTASGVVTLDAPGTWEVKAVDGGYATSPTVLGPNTLVVRNMQTITFANPGNRTYGSAPFALGATATSGLPVSYSLTGPASVSGSTLSITGLGTVTVTASQAGDSNFAPASDVVQSFTVTGPQGPIPPSDVFATAPDCHTVAVTWSKPLFSDGIIAGYRIFAAENGMQLAQIADPEANSYLFTNLAENTTYRYYVRSYSSSAESANSSEASVTTSPFPGVGDPSVASYRATTIAGIHVQAQGTGTVTVVAKGALGLGRDSTWTFTFTQPDGVWGPAQGEVPVFLQDNVGYRVEVSATGVLDYVVTVTPAANVSSVNRRLTIDSKFVDGVRKSEVVNGAFTLRSDMDNILPFGVIDLAQLETSRYINFGLGANVAGRSAGILSFNSVTCLGGYAVDSVSLDYHAGAGAEWPALSTPDHLQLRTRSGYVDIAKQAGLYMIRFFGDGTYPFRAGFYEFGSSVPLVSYKIEYNRPQDSSPIAGRGWAGAQSVVITRTAGSTVRLYEYRTDFYNTLTSFVSYPGASGSLDQRWNYEDFAIVRLWPWRAPAATKPNLTEILYRSTYEVVHLTGISMTKSPPREISVRKIKYAGPTSASAQLHYERSDYANGDHWLAGKPTAVRLGVPDTPDEHYVSVSRAIDPIEGGGTVGTVSTNSTGGAVLIEYFHESDLVYPGNFGTRPLTVIGKPKELRRSWLDAPPQTPYGANPDDLVTTYEYQTQLNDTKTLISTEITRQGQTIVGQKSYTYSTGILNGLETLQSTATEYTSGTEALATTTRVYSSRASNPDFRDKPVAVIRPDGTKTAYAYQRGELSGDTWTSGGSGDSYFLIAELNGKIGIGVTAYRGVELDSLDMEAGRSTVTERIFDPQSRLVREATFVYTGTAFEMLSAVYRGYDALGNLVFKSDQPDGAGRVFYEAGCSGFRKDWEKDEVGIRRSILYDDYDRVFSVTTASAGSTAAGDFVPERTTTYSYDAVGRLQSETISSPGETRVLITSYTYDTGSRLKTRTVPGNFTTTTTYDSPTQTTVTNSDGGTVVTTVFKDGRAKSTAGTAVAGSRTSYSYSASGDLVTRTELTGDGSGATTTLVTDWIGREVSTTSSAWNGSLVVSVPTYKATTGQIISRSTRVSSNTGEKLAPDHLFCYDPYGRLWREAADTNGTGVIENGSDSDIREYESEYTKTVANRLDSSYSTLQAGNAWFRYDGVKIYPYEGTIATTARCFSQTYTQLSGLSADLAANSYAIDFDSNITRSFASIDRAAKQQTFTTLTTGSSQAACKRLLNGQVMESTDLQGLRSAFTYDGLGRPTGVSDPRIDPLLGVTTTTYLNEPGDTRTTMLVESICAIDGKTTHFGYDSAGRQVVTRASDDTLTSHKISYCQYDQRGNLTHVWGDTVNPVKYVYDERGHRTEMHTYRSGTWAGPTLPAGFSGDGDKTTWSYDSASGLLSSKADATDTASTPRRVSYTYDAAGRMLSRTDARGVVTTYAYFDASYATTAQFTGRQRSITYSPGSSGAAATTDLAYTYHRNGKIKTVDDVAGRHVFSYYETSDNLQGYSARLREEVLPAGFFGNRSLTYGYQYSVAGRRNGDASFVQYGTEADYRVTYGYDDRLRLQRVASSVTALPFDYSYMADSNLVESVAQWVGNSTTTSYRRVYDYEVTSDRLENLQHSWGATPLVPAEPAKTVEARLGYNVAGLRSTEQTDGVGLMTTLGRSTGVGLHTEWSYTGRRELDTSGQFDLSTTIPSAWAKTAAVADADRDFDYDPIGNRIADRVAGQSGSYTSNALNQYVVAPGAASLTYDLAGNLIGDGLRTYTYDAENRLASVTQGGTTTTFRYDYLGRRISKNAGGSGTRFIYDGWNLVAEIADQQASFSVRRSFTWGLDASGSLQGAGGVGGLLCIASGSSRYYPIYDGSFNIIGLYDGTGSIVAAYRYDPFGNVSQQSAGAAAAANPFGFSTKYTDRETGLVYYGLRYYHAPLGRFINRDPIEEKGGLNLYGFCRNDAANRWDYLGLDGAKVPQKETPEQRTAREQKEAEELAKALANAARGREIQKYGISEWLFLGGAGGPVDRYSVTAPAESSTQTKPSTENDGDQNKPILGILTEEDWDAAINKYKISAPNRGAGMVPVVTTFTGTPSLSFVHTSMVSSVEANHAGQMLAPLLVMALPGALNDEFKIIDPQMLVALPLVGPELKLAFEALPALALQVEASLQIGQKFEGVAGTPMMGWTRHGLNQSISRDGVGVAPQAILDALRNPVEIKVTTRATEYIGAEARVILNADGKMITVNATSQAGTRVGAPTSTVTTGSSR